MRSTQRRSYPSVVRGAAPVTAMVVLAAAAALLCLAGSVVAGGTPVTAGRPVTARVVMIMLPSLDWPELHAGMKEGRLPNFARLAGGGSLGLMNTVTAGRQFSEDAYVTIGAGTRAVGGMTAGLAGERGESHGAGPVDRGLSTEEIYETRMGSRPPAAGALHLGLPGMVRANEEGRYLVVPGALGEELHRIGVRTGVAGNADAPAVGLARGSMAVAMDRAGAVDEALIGRAALVRDPRFPGGWRTDYDRLFTFFSSLGEDVGLVVIETGDLWRLDVEGPNMDRQALAAVRRQALARADALAGRVAGALAAGQDFILIVSPFPSETARRAGAWLTPVIAWGRGMPRGLLTSATTRQPGLVANIDLAATVLTHHGGGSPWFLAGRPAYGVSAGAAGAVDRVDALYRRTFANHLRRSVLVKGYVFFEIGVVLASLLALVSRARAAAYLQPLLVAGTAMPLALLILAGLPLWGQGWAYVAAVFLVAALTGLALAGRGRTAVAPFGLIASVTAVAVLADALAGSRLMANSPLGHSLIGGARFYGIGNEFMGVMLGAGLIGGTALLDLVASRGERGQRGQWGRWGRWGPLIVISFWLAMLVAIASPGVGANFGGTAAAAIAFSYVGLRLLLPGLRGPSALVVVASVTALLAATVLIDASRDASAQSHIGRAFAGLGDGGIGHLREIALRKLSMNLRLIRWTNWSLLFLVSLGTYVWLCFYPPAAMRRLLAPHPRLRTGFSGVATGAIAALIANDSGIVAAATAMIFATAPLISLALRDLSSPRA